MKLNEGMVTVRCLQTFGAYLTFRYTYSIACSNQIRHCIYMKFLFWEPACVLYSTNVLLIFFFQREIRGLQQRGIKTRVSDLSLSELFWHG